MGGDCMGWICGTVVAVGVGVAVGSGCAIASAEPAPASSSADPQAHVGPEPSKGAPSSGEGDDGESGPAGDAAAADDTHESADESAAQGEAPVSDEADTGDEADVPDAPDAEPKAEDPTDADAPSEEQPVAAVNERTEDAPAPASQDQPTSKSAAVIAAQPDSSVEEPAVSTAVVETKKQTQTPALAPPTQRAGAEETTTVVSLPIATAPAVENSLTYTPGPTFVDSLALLFHEAFRLITNLTGVNVYMLIQSLLVSDEPPWYLRYGLDTRRTEYATEDDAEWDVWEFRPPNPTGKTVIALHGGGWIYEPNLLHWIDYTDMARQTGATVIVPLYSLADTPAGRAEVVIPDTADFISRQIELHGACNVSIYADSAGSSIAMGAVRELVRRGDAVPSSMVLLSVVADTTLSNPAIRDVNDPIFNIDKLGGWTSYWPMNIDDPRDPRLSPLFMEDEILREFPPTTIYVGEREILYPDTLLLYQKAVAAGAPISVVVGTGQIHDWPLSGLAISSQTAAVRPDVFCELGLDQTCGAMV